MVFSQDMERVGLAGSEGIYLLVTVAAWFLHKRRYSPDKKVFYGPNDTLWAINLFHRSTF